MKIRQLIPLAVAAAIGAAAFTGCKTTEANYQAAYEKALAKRTEGLTEEELAGFRREEAMPKTVYKGDSIPLKGMYVRWVDGGVDKRALTYNVVVASFRQKFNAASVMKRMQDGGYDHAVLVEDKEGRYYVGATTTASLDTAVTTLRALQSSSPVVLRSPHPYILKRP